MPRSIVGVTLVALIACHPADPVTPEAQDCPAEPAPTPCPPPPADPEPVGEDVVEDAAADGDGAADGSNAATESDLKVFEAGPAPGQRESLLPEERRWVKQNCFEGAPKKTKNFGSTQIVAREPLALEHSSKLKIPLWVCEHVEKGELKKRALRTFRYKCGGKQKQKNLIPFLPDTKLPKGRRAELSDYKSSGYDRGHMAPAADFAWSWGAMEASFYLSNMAPQIGKGFNRNIWKTLEEEVRRYIKARGQGWIITGGMFKGNGSVKTIGANRVAVPTHFYKVVVLPKGNGHEAVAFVMKNADQPAASGYQPYVESIADVEKWTGLNFMPNLSSGQANAMESNKTDISGW